MPSICLAFLVSINARSVSVSVVKACHGSIRYNLCGCNSSSRSSEIAPARHLFQQPYTLRAIGAARGGGSCLSCSASERGTLTLWDDWLLTLWGVAPCPELGRRFSSPGSLHRSKYVAPAVLKVSSGLSLGDRRQHAKGLGPLLGERSRIGAGFHTNL